MRYLLTAPVVAVSAVVSAMFATPTTAQYPDKPVRIVVPYAPGGTSDFVARVTALKLQELTGKIYVIENKLGASGRTGYGSVARADGDGYTLVAVDTSYAMLPGLFGKLDWAHETDLVAITVTASTPVVIVAHPATGFKTLNGLIDYAKANPGKLNYGSGGRGSSTHLAAELLKSMAGLDIVHVPFKGAGDAVNGVLSDAVQVLIAAPPTVLGHVQGGSLSGLAVSSEERLGALPNVPTTREAGLPAYNVSNWFGLMAPKGTPPAVVAYLQQHIEKVLAQPDVREKLLAQGASPVGNSPADAATYVRTETELWSRVIREAKIDAQ
jgi:tripartite-type tricarboxylate transporter receptor subunit TctC